MEAAGNANRPSKFFTALKRELAFNIGWLGNEEIVRRTGTKSYQISHSKVKIPAHTKKQSRLNLV